MIPFKKMFPLNLTKQYFLFIVLVVTIFCIILTAIFLQSITQSTQKKLGKELFAIAIKLDADLSGSFNEILKQQNAMNKPIDEKVDIINSELQSNLEKLNYADIGMGYYDTELECIVAKNSLAPSSLEQEFHNYDKNNIYDSGMPELSYHKTDNSEPVLFQAYPITQKGNIIGYTWASMSLADIYASAFQGIVKIILVVIIALLIMVFFSWHIFKNISNDLNKFALAVANNKIDTSINSLPELNPLITQVRTQKEELEKHNQELQQLAFIVESSGDAIISTSMDGIITSWNKGAEQIYGYTESEITGSPISILIPENSNKFLNVLEKIKNMEKIVDHEAEHIKNDGIIIIVSVTISPITDNNGRVAGSSIIARDITERKKYESEIARFERLNLVGQMAAGIAHEIRNPMTTVRGMLQWVQNKEGINSNYHSHYNLMIEELDRANSIITEFLALAKNKPSEVNNQNLNSLIKKIQPLIMANAKKLNKEIYFNLNDVPDIFFNEEEIRQLIFNLARNGLEAVDQDGKIIISTYTVNNEVVLSVQDDGPGIDTEVISMVGTPFFTTKDHGTGLGLAVCYNIVDRHNAVINIDSSSEGTTFYVKFKKNSSQST